MKNRNIRTELILFVVLLFTTSVLHSQSSKNITGGQSYYNLSSTGDQSNLRLSTNPPSVKEFSAEKKKLLSDLDIARKSNENERANQLQADLNKIDGTVSLEQENDPRGTFKLADRQEISGQNDYNIIQVNNSSSWSNAVTNVPAGAPNAGRIWVTSTQFRNPGSDTIKFYYSDNSGSSWSYYGMIYFNYNLDFVNDELDIEAVYDGTNVWLYGVTGMYDYGDSRYKCMLFRFNTNGTGLYTSVINYPGIASSSNLYYNPRLCTDNTNYLSTAYVYIISSQDSLSGLNHRIKQQYVYLSNAFAPSPTFNYKNPSGNSGFYWTYAGTNNRIYLYGDIGYYVDNGGSNNNRIMTIYSDAGYGFNSMYLAWSDDFGSTIAGNLILPETNASTDARICFNGGPTFRSGMIVYRANYNGGPDWDIVYRNTTTGGSTAASWNIGYIDFTSNIARSSDVIAVRGASNVFKAAYSQMSGSTAYAYSSAFSGSWSAPIQVSNVFADTNWRKPRAGYINGGGDDCLTIWSQNNFNSTFASRLCNSTVEVEGNTNQIADKFSLSQNYPNPFNPSTTIKFSIPKTSMVRLVVYDASGKVSAKLINKTMTQGNYNVDFDASNLSSGVYFYKLETADYNSVKKMVLIK